MPKYYVSYDRTYVVTAEDENQAIDIAEMYGEQIDGEIFVEEAPDE